MDMGKHVPCVKVRRPPPGRQQPHLPAAGEDRPPEATPAEAPGHAANGQQGRRRRLHLLLRLLRRQAVHAGRKGQRRCRRQDGDPGTRTSHVLLTTEN